MTTATQTALPLPKPCDRCGKILTDPESIAEGKGPGCLHKIEIEKAVELLKKEGYAVYKK